MPTKITYTIEGITFRRTAYELSKAIEELLQSLPGDYEFSGSRDTVPLRDGEGEERYLSDDKSSSSEEDEEIEEIPCQKFLKGEIKPSNNSIHGGSERMQDEHCNDSITPENE